MDTSQVYSAAMIDEEMRKGFKDGGLAIDEWLFETDEDVTVCATEEQACFWQRQHRIKHGFDPITGEAT